MRKLELRELRKVTGVLIAIVIVWAVVVFLAYAGKALFEWFRLLDAALDVALPATLAGLSITAATFLSGRPAEMAAELTTLQDAATEKRGEAERAASALEISDAVDKGDAWIKGYLTVPSVVTINTQDFKVPAVNVWLERMRNVLLQQQEIDGLTEAKRNLTRSFMWFAVCLFEMLTLDLWVDGEKYFQTWHVSVIEATNEPKAFDLSIHGGLAFADVILGSTLLIGGVIHLCLGSRKIV